MSREKSLVGIRESDRVGGGEELVQEIIGIGRRGRG